MILKSSRTAKRRDRFARWIITVGGAAIIVTVAAILLLILKVAFPLFESPKKEKVAQWTVSGGNDASDPVSAIGVDEYLSTAFALSSTGNLRYYSVANPRQSQEMKIPVTNRSSHRILSAKPIDSSRYSLLWDDGVITIIQVLFPRQSPKIDSKGYQPQISVVASFPSEVNQPVPLAAQARMLPDGGQIAVRLLPRNRFSISQQVITRDIFDVEQTQKRSSVIAANTSGDITAFTLNSKGEMLYAGTSRGVVLCWDVRNAEQPRFVEQVRTSREHGAVTALSMVHGDESIAVGNASGQVTTWFPVASPSVPGVKKLRGIHTLKNHGSPVLDVLPSPRGKSVLSISRAGGVHLDYTTSERNLLSLKPNSAYITASFAPRNNGIVTLDSKKHLTVWSLSSPHPEISWKTLFGKVWYEGYDKPAYAWQSSSGSDDFEPKLSLVPLIYGSLKGTLYALIFAVPLALAGAIYTSQFATYRLRGTIKPTIEVMAAIPSVVIGFLIALWLGPLMERAIVSFFIFLIVLPAIFILFVLAWQLIRRLETIKRIEKGNEFLIIIPVILAAGLAAWALGPDIEKWLFGGNFKLWLFGEWGARYDQRNSIIVAFGLGFAVIPIIYTIAEDALSNVPYNLSVASLALGASRWQTVWRVILPSASPGIFAGIMIGFGRAVGETMIVLMATGNTPLMDWSPFNGMRTLAANIAVEIPEAPLNGTLYRVLFLSAVLLFIMTFMVNTAAELVRQRLRKKYGQFQ